MFRSSGYYRTLKKSEDTASASGTETAFVEIGTANHINKSTACFDLIRSV